MIIIFEQISTYKHDCVQQYKQLNQNNKLEDFIQANDLFCNKWTQYLRMFNVNDGELLVASNEAKGIAFGLENREKILKYDMFNGRLMKFEANKNPLQSLFGKITYIT